MRIQLNRPSAIARLTGGRDAIGLSGFVRFYQQPGGVVVEVSVFGLPYNSSGMYGFHIHEGAACSGVGFSATGGHYDPKGVPHPRHAGDLPSLLSCGGRAYLAVMTDRFSVQDVLGRTIVIHGMADDFTSQPSGNAGEKIACGVIMPVSSRRGGR